MLDNIAEVFGVTTSEQLAGFKQNPYISEAAAAQLINSGYHPECSTVGCTHVYCGTNFSRKRFKQAGWKADTGISGGMSGKYQRRTEAQRLTSTGQTQPQNSQLQRALEILQEQQAQFVSHFTAEQATLAAKLDASVKQMQKYLAGADIAMRSLQEQIHQVGRSEASSRGLNITSVLHLQSIPGCPLTVLEREQDQELKQLREEQRLAAQSRWKQEEELNKWRAEAEQLKKVIENLRKCREDENEDKDK